MIDAVANLFAALLKSKEAIGQERQNSITIINHDWTSFQARVNLEQNITYCSGKVIIEKAPLTLPKLKGKVNACHVTNYDKAQLCQGTNYDTNMQKQIQQIESFLGSI